MPDLAKAVECLAFDEAMRKHAAGLLDAAAAISPLMILAHPALRFADILSRRPGAFPKSPPPWSMWEHLNRYGLKLRREGA